MLIKFTVKLSERDREALLRIAIATERQAKALEELVRQQRQLHRAVAGEIVFGQPKEQKEG